MDFNRIHFDRILSRRSACGLIWLGTYQFDVIQKQPSNFKEGDIGNPSASISKKGDLGSSPCVIKMVMLTSGIHYDKTNQIYRKGEKLTSDEKSSSYVFAGGNLSERRGPRPIGDPDGVFVPQQNPVTPPKKVYRSPFLPYRGPPQGIFVKHGWTEAERKSALNGRPVTPQQSGSDRSLYFEKNDPDPFRHREFRHRRAISRQAFLHEVTELTHLGLLNLAPKVYGYYFSDCSAPIHYGFIVMEKVDCSLKEILSQRGLEKSEEEIINQTINQMHQSYGSVHGDLQPTNIGVYLNSVGQINRVCFFDCQKVKHKEKYSHREFQKLVEKDWKMYRKFSRLILHRRDGETEVPPKPDITF